MDEEQRDDARAASAGAGGSAERERQRQLSALAVSIKANTDQLIAAADRFESLLKSTEGLQTALDALARMLEKMHDNILEQLSDLSDKLEDAGLIDESVNDTLLTRFRDLYNKRGGGADETTPEDS